MNVTASLHCFSFTFFRTHTHLVVYMSQSHCLKELAIIAYWWLMTFITRELDIHCRSIDNSKHLCTSYETASVQRMRLSCFVKHLRNFGGTIFIWHHPLWISFKVHQRKSVSTFPMVIIWEALAPVLPLSVLLSTSIHSSSGQRL